MLAGIILAGATPGKSDPLAIAANVPKKSLIPIAGRPMVSYVYDALAGVERIQFIIVIGPTERDGITFSEKAILHPGFGDLLDNTIGALNLVREQNPEIEYVVMSASDIPLLTTDVVDAFIDMCLSSQHDLYYSVVEKSVMETAYPAAGRSYRRFGKSAYAGGDLHMVSAHIDVTNIEKVRQAISSRKSGLALARMLGLGTLVKFAMGRLTIEEAVKTAERALGISGRGIFSPYASLGMDVDKPHQLEMVCDILETTAR